MTKKHILTRILAALGGLMLCLMSGGMLAEAFCRIPMTEYASQLLNKGSAVAVLITLLAAFLLFICGVCCIRMLFIRPAMQERGFVLQKGESGTIGVSVKSIEGLVQTCVQQHENIAESTIRVDTHKDSIDILLHVMGTAGVNIPVVIGTLQKQIKSYVNECTGLDVREVRVMVENTEAAAPLSGKAVERPSQVVPARVDVPVSMVEPAYEAPSVLAAPVEETPAHSMYARPAETPVAETAAETMAEFTAVPAEPVGPLKPEMPAMVEQEDDDRPLHQRLFGAEEQPVIVPTPPDVIIEPAPEEIPPVVAQEVPVQLAGDDPDGGAVPEAERAIAAEGLADDAASGPADEIL